MRVLAVENHHRLTRLSELQKLYLHYNGLTGTVPSLSGMHQLTFIHIGGNGLHGGVGLHGGLEWLGELQALEEVLIWDNAFSGPLPERMRTMRALKSLELGVRIETQRSPVFKCPRHACPKPVLATRYFPQGGFRHLKVLAVLLAGEPSELRFSELAGGAWESH